MNKMKVRLLTVDERNNPQSAKEALDTTIQKWYNLHKCRKINMTMYNQRCGLCSWYYGINGQSGYACKVCILGKQFKNNCAFSGTLYNKFVCANTKTKARKYAKQLYELLVSLKDNV